MKFIGLDAGSVSVKLAVLDEKGRILHNSYQRHRGQPLAVALELLKAVDKSGVKSQESDSYSSILTPHSSRNDLSLSVTGSAGRLIGEILGIAPVNEVVAYAFANRKLYPDLRTIIELGGEDSKLILLDEGSLAAKDFSMNSVCAAGTGSFLDQQAERLRLSIEEFGELSLKSKKPPRIAGRCSVFAKSDMIHLQQIATSVEDIVAGLCFAVARNFKGTIARGRMLKKPFSFQGGVAANAGMIRAFSEVFDLDDLFVPKEHALMGAIGAALKGIDAGICRQFSLGPLEEFIHSERIKGKGHHPLIMSDDNFLARHKPECHNNDTSGAGNAPFEASGKTGVCEKQTAYLGVDIGSISTNLALLDENGNLLAKRYLMTAGRPIEAVKRGLEEIGDEIGGRVEIAGVGTTGSGRYMIADYIGADIVKNEITAQAAAAAFIDKEVDTIFEIGGQDSKYISLRNGIIVDFEMNKACAAGTGSFIEEQAEKLDISVKDEFECAAFKSTNPCRLGERCTVFMENSLMTNLQRGVEREDLLAGLAYSIVQNYINRVVGKRHIGERIFFQGGVAFNKAVVAAFEKYLGRQITVPQNHDVTGAIGMALIARDHMKKSEESGVRSRGGVPPPAQESEGKFKIQNSKFNMVNNSSPLTTFKGFELSKRSYEISSFECNGCSNVCEINRIKMEGEKGHLYYGGRCEKYDVRKKKTANRIPDLFAFREEMLWKEHLKYSEENEFKIQNSKFKTIADSSPLTPHPSPRIGIPYIFYFHDFLPFWTTLLWELGFEVEVSPKTDRNIIDTGLGAVLSETCFPVKTAHGHIKYLIDRDLDAIFLPSFVSLNASSDILGRGVACPYTQSIPYVSRVAFRDIKAITPVIDLDKGDDSLKKELMRALKPFGIRPAQMTKALAKARKAQDEFIEAIKAKGQEILSTLDELSIVITGRAYNSFDSGVNLNIPRKLSDLGVLAIPMDFLPVESRDIRNNWPNMYWRAGQRILSAAQIIRENPFLYPVYIGNFSCGPDSFILKFFEEELALKPYLHLEIDAHSADAGAITRCEAFLDSIRGRGGVTPPVQEAEAGDKGKKTLYPSLLTSRSKRIVYLPRMSDHSFALAAAFESCGVGAEVLPESTKESVDLGKKFVSGKECYPCAITTGDMVMKVMEPGFDADRSAFFMPSGRGPCRFGQYNVFQRLVIKELGLEGVPVFAPDQDESFYEQLGIIGKGFVRKSWEGIIAVELINKCLHETRPYEKEKGASDDLFNTYLQKVYQSSRGVDGRLSDVLKNARKDFEAVRRHNDKRPLIGIVGEIFVRSNRFSNEEVIRKIESLGGEAYLAPVEEWLYYVNYLGIRKLLIKKDWSGMISLSVKRLYQKRIEHRFAGYFKGFLKTLHEPGTGELLSRANPYIHPSFEGEAILSIGKSIDMINQGVSGIISVMPFGCMPGTIVSGLMRGLNNDFGIPCLSIPYDGNESLTTEIQIEAFLDQAKEYKKNRK